MFKDVLAKSAPDARNDSFLGVMSEDFDSAVRTLHYPLTPEVEFRSIKELRKKLEATVRKMGKGGIRNLSIHGHGKKYENGVAVEMGNDILHHSTIASHEKELTKIGALFTEDGKVELLHCFAGSGSKLMPKLAKILGVPVSGQTKLNGLSPVLEPVQNAVSYYATGSLSKIVGAGARTYTPDGKVK